jgi:hypothetical protein
VKVLDTFAKVELGVRRQQYEHCRDRLLTFKDAA